MIGRRGWLLALCVLTGACSSGGGGTSSGAGTGATNGSSTGSSGTTSGGAPCTASSCTAPQQCDLSTGQCVDCLSPSDCPANLPGCVSGFCGSCQATTDCPSPLTCDTGLGICTCTSSSDCSGIPTAPICVPNTQQCGCGNATQCGGAGLVCDKINYPSGLCVSPCTATSGCMAGSTSPYCVTTPGAPNLGVCVPCVDDSQCSNLGLGSFCTAGGCVNCRTNADCSGSTPICVGSCVQCGQASDCSAGQGCNSTTYQCGTCVLNSDCPSGEGCTPLGTCGDLCISGQSMTNCAACVFDSDCPQSDPYCGLNGVCGSMPSDGGMQVGPCGAGCGGGLVCDDKTATCVECRMDSDCNSAQATKCDVTNNTCVQCLAPTDCPYDNPGCTQGFCGACGASTDCPANDTCNTDTGHCQCSGATGCGGDAPTCLANHACGCQGSQCGTGLLCNAVAYTNGACVTNCATGTACPPNGADPYCDKSTSSATYGLCLPCLNDQQCMAAGQGPYCTAQGCVYCRTNTDCSGGTPYCNIVCVQCASPSECTGGEGCNSATGKCGTCSLSTDCPDGGACTQGVCK